MKRIRNLAVFKSSPTSESNKQDNRREQEKENLLLGQSTTGRRKRKVEKISEPRFGIEKNVEHKSSSCAHNHWKTWDDFNSKFKNTKTGDINFWRLTLTQPPLIIIGFLV